MKKYKYLVTHYSSEFIDEDTPDGTYSVVFSARQIFNHFMDMQECYCVPDDYQIDIYRINGIGLAPSECSFLRPGHDPSDPLKMAIVGDGIREEGYMIER